MIAPLTRASLALVVGLTLVQPATAGEGWLPDLGPALELAREQDKDVLVDFTGSDWCGWCIRLD